MHPLLLHPNPNTNNLPPSLPIPPIICSNNTMIMISLAQMTYSDKCGSLRNVDIFNLPLGSGP